MSQTSTNITSKYRQEMHYNYAKNSVFFASNCSPLLCYRFVTTTLIAQIPAETLSQSHWLFIVLRFCAIVSLPLHLLHKFLRKRYRKATGFASCFCAIAKLTAQILRKT